MIIMLCCIIVIRVLILLNREIGTVSIPKVYIIIKLGFQVLLYNILDFKYLYEVKFTFQVVWLLEFVYIISRNFAHALTTALCQVLRMGIINLGFDKRRLTGAR